MLPFCQGHQHFPCHLHQKSWSSEIQILFVIDYFQQSFCFFFNSFHSDPSVLTWTFLVQWNMCSVPRTLSNSYNRLTPSFYSLPIVGHSQQPKQINRLILTKILSSSSHTSARKPTLTLREPQCQVQSQHSGM